MDKKIKFSDQPLRVKIIYAAVILVLVATAIAVGVASAANRKDVGENPDGGTTPPVTDGTENGDGQEDGDGEENKTPEKLSLISPLVGTLEKGHDLFAPVFSETLGEWRVHTGIDIGCEEGAEVLSAAAGTVTDVKSDPFLGKTVVVTHSGGIVSRYTNLSEEVAVNVGDKVSAGDRLGYVGDTSLSELADEPHLHFEVTVNGKSVNPLDYISEDSKKVSLGITEV